MSTNQARPIPFEISEWAREYVEGDPSLSRFSPANEDPGIGVIVEGATAANLRRVPDGWTAGRVSLKHGRIFLQNL